MLLFLEATLQQRSNTGIVHAYPAMPALQGCFVPCSVLEWMNHGNRDTRNPFLWSAHG